MSEESKELEPLVDSPYVNRLLLRHARKSYAEIAKLTGIPVGEVAERLTELLYTTDLREDLYKENVLLEEIGMLVDDIRERMSRTNVEDEGWASMARVQLQAIKTIMEQMEKRRKAVEGKLATLSMEQAHVMVEAFKLARDFAVKSIAEKYPDVDTDIIYVEFDEALPHAIEHLEERANG